MEINRLTEWTWVRKCRDCGEITPLHEGQQPSTEDDWPCPECGCTLGCGHLHAGAKFEVDGKVKWLTRADLQQMS